MKMKHKAKRLLSLLLFCGMILGMMPMTTFVAGATETKSPVTVDNTVYEKGNCEIWFSINEVAEDNVVINVMDEVMSLISENNGYFNPGNQFNVKVHIKNNSPNAFLYNSNGLKLGTKKVNEGDAVLTNFIGYDGNKLALSRIGGMDYNHPAMKELISSKDFKLVMRMYDLLKDKGYEGKTALSDYFLDYYKKRYDDQSMTWNSLMKNHRDDVINDFSQSGPNVLFTITEEELKEVENTAFKDFTYIVNKRTDGTYRVHFKWPEEQLAALSYNIFYKDLLTITFGDEKVDPMDGMRDRGVGDYIDHESEAYTKAYAYLASICDDGQIASGKEVTFNMTMTLEGNGTGNMYANYDFDNALDLFINLERATTDINVTKVWQDNDDQDGIRPDDITVQLLADGEVVKDTTLILNSGNKWTGSFTELPKYKNGKEIVYTVEEVKVEGYTTVISGNAKDGFVITNSHTPKPPTEPTEPTEPSKPSNPDGSNPNTGVNTPQTGDNSNIFFWVALLLISSCGLAINFVFKKRISAK